MLIRRKKNKGFTLVEVIVSMLVLSITIVSVLTAFSLSAKSNTQTKKIQSAESLMEDLVEYTTAYTKDLDPEKSLKDIGFFAGVPYGSCVTNQELSDTQMVEITTYNDVQKGFYKYKVEVTRDTKPDDYTNLNNHSVVSFGATGSNTALIDASLKGNDLMDADGNSVANNVNDYDEMALDLFWSMHCTQLDYLDAQAALVTPIPTATPTPLPKPTKEQVRDIIDREILLEAVSPATDKIQLKVYMVYKLTKNATDFPLPDGMSRELKINFYTSAIFDAASVTTAGAQKLDQIYLLYSPWTEEELGGSRNVDIRISDSYGVLGADIYLVYQETADSAPAVSSVHNSSLANRFGTTKLYVHVDDSPQRVDLYSSVGIERGGSASGDIQAYNNTLVSTSQELRVQQMTIKVIDPETNQELASTTMACLR